MRIEISSKTGQVKATKFHDKTVLPYPLRLEADDAHVYFMVISQNPISKI